MMCGEGCLAAETWAQARRCAKGRKNQEDGRRKVKTQARDFYSSDHAMRYETMKSKWIP